MSRVKLKLPEQFNFFTTTPVRITDINYGNHLGNDAVLSFIHEARVQFLKSFNLEELKFEGIGLIMSDAAIEFKNEAFYGDVLKVYVTASEPSRIGFSLFYKLVVQTKEGEKNIAYAKTGMICYDYNLKKVVPFPTSAERIFK
ncbi:MAG: thioesterase family protein [Chitinophagaceae bacterium]